MIIFLNILHKFVHLIVLVNDQYNHFVMNLFVLIHPIINVVFLLYQINLDEYLELVFLMLIEFVVIYDVQFQIENKYSNLLQVWNHEKWYLKFHDDEFY